MKKRIYFIVLILAIWFVGTRFEVRAQEIGAIVSESSADKREPISLKLGTKKVFASKDKIPVELYNENANVVEAKLKNDKNEEVAAEIIQNDEAGTTSLTVNPPAQFRPGKYKLEMKDQTGLVIEQNFLWGVLAINPNKTIYQKDETAKMAIAVLDEQGKMVCDANVKLRVTNSDLKIDEELSTNNGKIIINPECSSKEYTLKPDYETKYQLKDSGVYKLELTAVTTNGTYTISDQIEVKNETNFEIERISATRINPVNTYPMTINITANSDFNGKVYETVPDGFEITQLNDLVKKYQIVDEGNGVKKIEWTVNLKKGDKLILGYKYKTPQISPQFYLLGPMSLSNLTDLAYSEGRQWQLAADDLPASGFYMQTGYYIGNGNFNHVSGLGFRPQMVIIKSDTNTLETIFKTDVMPNNATEFLGSATAENTAGYILLEDDGFTVSTTAASANIRFTWTAFGGSDCSATGVFCVGAYMGNATYPRTIATGFAPDLAWIKRNTAVAAGWKSTAMLPLGSLYFQATAGIGTTDYFADLNSTGFGVGISTNVSGGLYYYAAFKEVAGSIDVGVTFGLGANGNVDTVGFKPDWMFIRNANVATTGAIWEVAESNGNNSSYFTKTANLTAAIRELRTNGFGLGTNAAVSGVGNTLYWAAFKGETTPLSSSGTFKMTEGSYLGTGNPFVINNLTFAPNLVIVKGNTAQAGVFRTDQMAGDSTGYLDSATANLTGAITDLTDHGFNIGSSAVVNSVGVSYYWTAYGNAWRPGTKSGASDFFIGAYTGNGIASSIDRLPYAADLLAIKRNGATGGVFKTNLHVGTSTSFFAATADTNTNIDSLDVDGFSVSTSNNVNAATSLYWFYGFKTGVGFTMGYYTGNATSGRGINVGFQPDYVWIKGVGGTRGVTRFGDMVGDGAIPFINIGTTTNSITGIGLTDFTLGTAGETNKSGLKYWYTAWKSTGVESTTPDVTEASFRWSDDSEGESHNSSWLAAENTDITAVNKNTNIRLRFSVVNVGGTATASYRLQMAPLGAAVGCTDVVSGNFVDLPTTFGVGTSLGLMTTSPNFTDQDSTTRQLTISGTTYTAGNMVEYSSNQTNSITLAKNKYTEMEYVFQITTTAADNTAYCFRTSNAGAGLDHYTNVAKLTTSLDLPPSANSFQRKTFYDQQNSRYWKTYFGGTEVNTEYSGNGIAWSAGTGLSYPTNDFSVWYASIGDTEFVFVAVADNNDIKIRQGILTASSVTWDADVATIFDGASTTDSYSYPYITLDNPTSGNPHVWISARYFDGTNYVVKTRSTITTAEADPSIWTYGTSTQISVNQTNSNVYSNIVPMTGGDMYATWMENTTIKGKTYDAGVTGVVDAAVTTTGDDGVRYSGSGFTSTNAYNTAGAYTNLVYHTYARFTGVSIAGTIINSYMKVYGYGTAGTPVTIINAVDADNPSAPTNAATFDAMAVTTAGVGWTGAWSSGVQYTSDSLNNIFQELVGKYTISNDAIILEIRNDGATGTNNNQWEDYTNNSAHAVTLHIEYQVGAWEATANTIDTGVSGLSKNFSTVVDASGNIHLLYVDNESTDQISYSKLAVGTTNWTTATLVSGGADNNDAYVSLSLDSTNNYLYAFWIDTSNSNIFYSYCDNTTGCDLATEWAAESGQETNWYSTGTNTNITTNYSAAGKIFGEWSNGVSPPYTLLWDDITVIVSGGPTAPVINQILRHGMWFLNGVKQKFTF